MMTTMMAPLSESCPACEGRHVRIDYTDPLVCDECERIVPRAIVSAAELGRGEVDPITVATVSVRLSDGLVVRFYCCRILGDWIEFYGQAIDADRISAYAIRLSSIVAAEWRYETILSIDALRIRGWLDLP